MSINFNDLHDKMYQRKTNLISKQDFYEWLDSNIEIKKYIPVTKKYAIASISSRKVFSKMEGLDISTDLDFIFLQYELEKLFTVITSYTGLKIDSKSHSPENYDLIYESGFYEYLSDNTGKDLNTFEDVCDRVSGVNTLSIMQQFVTFIGKQPSVEDMEKIKDIINNDIDKDKLQILQTVQEYNNPMMKSVIDSVKKEEIIKVMEKK